MDGKIFNSQGVHVATVRGSTIFSLRVAPSGAALTRFAVAPVPETAPSGQTHP
jgi:hypothetical protein